MITILLTALLLIPSVSYAGVDFSMRSEGFSPVEVPMFKSTPEAQEWAKGHVGNPYVISELKRRINETSDGIQAILLEDGDPQETIQKASALSKVNQRYRAAFTIVDAAMVGSMFYAGEEPI